MSGFVSRRRPAVILPWVERRRGRRAGSGLNRNRRIGVGYAGFRVGSGDLQLEGLRSAGSGYAIQLENLFRRVERNLSLAILFSLF